MRWVPNFSVHRGALNKGDSVIASNKRFQISIRRHWRKYDNVSVFKSVIFVIKLLHKIHKSNIADGTSHDNVSARGMPNISGSLIECSLCQERCQFIHLMWHHSDHQEDRKDHHKLALCCLWIDISIPHCGNRHRCPIQTIMKVRQLQFQDPETCLRGRLTCLCSVSIKAPAEQMMRVTIEKHKTMTLR